MFVLDFPRKGISNGQVLKTANSLTVSVIKALASFYPLNVPPQLLPER